MKLSLPSLTEIVNRSAATFKRFPVAMVLAIIGTGAAIWLSDLNYTQEKEYYWLLNLVFLCGVGISFFTAITTFAESEDWPLLKSLGLKALGLILLIAYYFSFPESAIVEEPYVHIYRFVLLFLASHLWVAVAPFLRNRDIHAFWGYNKVLFLNILTSALYSAALFFGLSIALLSIDVLLGIHIDGITYLQLWFFMVGVFNTWFFLSRVPEPGNYASEMTAYPNGLKVFVQYVLIPLVTVYILILYLYMIKIVVQWELPEGWVANLVLSFSIAGILSLLLLYPIQDKENNQWMRIYFKSYFYGLVPLVVLLYISIWTRISEYGVTINRFFVATLAVWLSGIVLYFIFSRKKNIKLIPISLGVIALLISFGPVGAFSVSERSQKGRVAEYLDAYGYLNAEGKVQSSDQEMPREDLSELSSSVSYLISNHGLSPLEGFFEGDLKQELQGFKEDSLSYWSDEKKIMDLIGLEYIGPYHSINSKEEYFSFTVEQQGKYSIAGYDELIPQIYFNSFNDNFAREGYRFDFDQESMDLRITREEPESEIRLSVRDHIRGLFESGQYDNIVPRQLMMLEAENEKFRVAIIFNTIQGEIGSDTTITSLSFQMLVSDQ